MRALIRVTIVDPSGSLSSREDRENHDKEIIALFKAVGYDPRSLGTNRGLPTESELEESPEVRSLFENLEGTILEEERKHLLMLGYTNAGQARFVVCSTNPKVLHIRVRDDLFEKLRVACAEICVKIWKHSAQQRLRNFISRKPQRRRYLQLHDVIEVMEPAHKTATILGNIIRRPLRAVFKYHQKETLLAVFTLVTSVLLFWYAPDLAPPLTKTLATLKSFKVEYIQGALERTYSALLVTFAVTGVQLLLRYFEFRKSRPIMWNAGIEPTRGPQSDG